MQVLFYLYQQMDSKQCRKINLHNQMIKTKNLVHMLYVKVNFILFSGIIHKIYLRYPNKSIENKIKIIYDNKLQDKIKKKLIKV